MKQKEIDKIMKKQNDIDYIYDKVLSDSGLQADLMTVLNKSWSTIYRWARKKDIMLTTKLAIDTIELHIANEKKASETETSK